MNSATGRLSGKVALVVGAGVPGAIGAAAARVLAGDGARVVLADLATASLGEVADALKAEGFEVVTCEVDLTEESSVEALLGFVRRTCGRLDALLNNAAATHLAARDRGVVDMDVALWDHAFAVLLVCKYALPLMIESGGGSIVNVSSGQSLRGDTQFTAYGASKAALNSLTRSIANIYGDSGIRANTVAPGVIQTRMMKSAMPPDMSELVRECTLLGRLGDPSEIANVVLFLASDRSSYMTGQLLQCDGGILDHVPVRAGVRRMMQQSQLRSHASGD